MNFVAHEGESEAVLIWGRKSKYAESWGGEKDARKGSAM